MTLQKQQCHEMKKKKIPQLQSPDVQWHHDNYHLDGRNERETNEKKGENTLNPNVGED